jgi:hypothetical protein
VTGWYATAVVVVALALAVWTLALVVLDRPPSLAVLVAACVLELMLLVFAIGGVVQMVGAHHSFARWEFVGYLLALLLVPVAAVGWGWGEKTRSGTAVIAVGFLVVPVLVLRVQQVWAGPPHV